MRVRLDANGASRTAEIAYCADDNATFVKEWQGAVGDDRHPLRRNAVEFAENAWGRWKAYQDRDNYASVSTILEFSSTTTRGLKLRILSALRCDWYPPASIIGICHFRRSWCNNLIIDYLSAHPHIARPRPKDMIVKGVGTSLLYYLAKIAVQLNCEIIWGEATQNSCRFYQGVFDLDSVQDLILAPKPAFSAFYTQLAAKLWRTPRMDIKEMTLEEIYDFEFEALAPDWDQRKVLRCSRRAARRARSGENFRRHVSPSCDNRNRAS